MKFLWIFDHDAVMVTPFITASLYALGGSGPKIIRRMFFSAFISLASFSLGLEWYWAWIIPSIFLLTTTTPYGMKTHAKLHYLYFPYLFLLGTLYGLGLFPLCFHFGGWLTLVIGSVACGLFFSLGTAASQSKIFQNIAVWKVVELGTGFILGLIAYLIYL